MMFRVFKIDSWRELLGWLLAKKETVLAGSKCRKKTNCSIYLVCLYAQIVFLYVLGAAVSVGGTVLQR